MTMAEKFVVGDHAGGLLQFLGFDSFQYSVDTHLGLLHFPLRGLALILHFCMKSQGLGTFSLLNNESTQMSSFRFGPCESPYSLLELLTAAGLLLLGL